MKFLPLLLLLTVSLYASAAHSVSSGARTEADSVSADSALIEMANAGHTIPFRHTGPLTEQDFIEAAAELGCEPAAIHAVVDIEAGVQHKGFWKKGYPLINFDLSIFRTMARRHNVNLSKYTRSHAEVFARPNRKKYGGYLPAQQARFESALTIDTVSAIEGTFWGMFQIGGFNWRKCGASSAQDFARTMARSERDQLELFIAFLRSTGLDRHLRSLSWSAFARGYNGPSYAKRGYHTRLAKAYAKYKNREKTDKAK